MTESAVLEGRHFTATEAKRHTLGDLIDHHFSEVLPQKRPSTIPTQTQHLHWWKSQLGHFLLADVTPAIVVAYRNMRTYGHANATVNRYLAVLSHTFTMAVREWQWCTDNPVWKVSSVLGMPVKVLSSVLASLRCLCLPQRELGWPTP